MKVSEGGLLEENCVTAAIGPYLRVVDEQSVGERDVAIMGERFVSLRISGEHL